MILSDWQTAGLRAGIDWQPMSVSRDALLDWLQVYAALVGENRDYLTELDAAIGDADHGHTLHRGWQAVLARLPALANREMGAILKVTGMTLASTVGGASGPLYGTLFSRMGLAVGSKRELTLDDWTAALEDGVYGVMTRGKANLGDKTMVDALVPAVHALKAAAGEGLPEALRRSELAAEHSVLATIALPARKARASYPAGRGVGHQDPGATSSYLLLKAAADAWCCL